MVKNHTLSVDKFRPFLLHFLLESHQLLTVEIRIDDFTRGQFRCYIYDRQLQANAVISFAVDRQRSRRRPPAPAPHAPAQDGRMRSKPAPRQPPIDQLQPVVLYWAFVSVVYVNSGLLLCRVVIILYKKKKLPVKRVPYSHREGSLLRLLSTYTAVLRPTTEKKRATHKQFGALLCKTNLEVL
ncbi:hypothetical protein EVAR_95278_1 [Eumeta japonica]|uniref:Uncharacterized protein n=1 Tax=Eumeta variegata TaxID=151549 RepID=A0A4C1ULC3_EUMVA|nr:hypothetical protein EVAR_95278_1 [Eumeta japonica]